VDHWDEVRTAYHVARLGTVSGAAEILGVHHATVIRHVDALEERLGVKLFQRHARGYTPTEAGRDLLQVAQATEDQLNQLAGRIKGRGDTVSGELVVTSVAALTGWLTPILAGFQRANPEVSVRLLSDARLFRLEYGEAHVAVRAGSPPDQPDNVVQRLAEAESALYGSREYLARYGHPTSEEELAGHRFVGIDPASPAARSPSATWTSSLASRGRIVFQTSDERAIVEATVEGAGLGLLGVLDGAQYPELVQVLQPREEWRARFWLVTHVDLHRTPKVQALLKALKAGARETAERGPGLIL